MEHANVTMPLPLPPGDINEPAEWTIPPGHQERIVDHEITTTSLHRDECRQWQGKCKMTRTRAGCVSTRTLSSQPVHGILYSGLMLLLVLSHVRLESITVWDMLKYIRFSFIYITFTSSKTAANHCQHCTSMIVSGPGSTRITILTHSS